MNIGTERKDEIVRGIAEVKKVCDRHGLVCEWNEAVDVSWLEVWADGVDNLADFIEEGE